MKTHACLVFALLSALLACKGTHDSSAPPGSSSAAPASGAPKITLGKLTLETLEQGGTKAGWKVRSSSEHGSDKSLRTLGVILEERTHDGYITLLEFTEKPSESAAAKLGRERAVLVIQGVDAKADQLLQKLVPEDADRATRDSLKENAKTAGWTIESSHLDTDVDEGVGYVRVDLELSHDEHGNAEVSFYDFGKSAAAGRALVEGSRVLVVNVPDKQSMTQPILKRIAEVSAGS